jgi:hypothetical protein
MKIVHVISVGINGGENIIQKYNNYIDVYKKFGIEYQLIILSPLDVNVGIVDNRSIVNIQVNPTTNKCLLKRVWLKAIPKLEQYLESIEYTHIILRIDFIDKVILNFTKKYQPILEYPMYPIETILEDKPLYHKLANRHNPIALKYSLFNITPIDNIYKNSYVFQNSLHDKHVKKEKFELHKTIKVLFMSSRYVAKHFNGYDRFLQGIENYLESKDKKYQFEFYVAGKDIEGFKSMLSNTISSQIKITYLGFQTIEQLNKVIPSLDIGVNDLAFHRNNVTISNTLKTIDFIGWRLPFVISTNDANLIEKQKFYLKVQEDESAINIYEVISFLESIDDSIKMKMDKVAKEISLEKRIEKFIQYLKNYKK